MSVIIRLDDSHLQGWTEKKERKKKNSPSPECFISKISKKNWAWKFFIKWAEQNHKQDNAHLSL